MRRISVQIISDIHLEFYKSYPKIKPLAKYLFLAGDIGTIKNQYDFRVKKFLSYCSMNWEKTFYVLGNHEFYQTDERIDNKINFEELELKYNKICLEFSNVYLLSNSFAEIEPGINVYGTTLWTGNYGYSYNVSDILNDYNMISIKSKINGNISINENYINNLSITQLEKLKKYLDNAKNVKIIILTHFPPIRQGVSNPKYFSQPEYIANYFSWNDIYKQLNTTNVVGWISGHTHWSYDITLDNIRFISNQMGYNEECQNDETGFEPSKVSEFEY